IGGLKSYEETAQATDDGFLEHVRLQDRIDRACSLPQPAHAAHSVEESRCEAGISEEMISQEAQMTARQAVDLRESGVDRLRVERAATFEKCLLVAKVAYIRTAS